MRNGSREALALLPSKGFRCLARCWHGSYKVRAWKTSSGCGFWERWIGPLCCT